MSSYTPLSTRSLAPSEERSIAYSDLPLSLSPYWLILGVSLFLVSVPVFFQAPLVRLFPWLSLGLTGGWLALSLKLLSGQSTRVGGDLLLGFTWTWLAGSLYWGWLRWEPYWHLPVEAIALPLVIYFLWRRQLQIGSWFYLGSLLGTAITDLYFYQVNLIPHWRQLMQITPALATPIFQSAIAQMQTSWGISWAVLLAVMLVIIGITALQTRQLPQWAFAGAVLSTLLVDGLFWLAAANA